MAYQSTAGLWVSITASLADSRSGLEQNFLHPGFDAKPWVFWYWIAGNVTQEGITYDLESMAAAGIGGAYIFSIDRPDYESYVKVDQAVDAPSDQFWNMVRFATEEADRLGMKVALNACDGWSLAGGSWITPELSMQQLVSTTVVIRADLGETNAVLDRPLNTFSSSSWQTTNFNSYYQDIKVLAYPAARGWGTAISTTNWASARKLSQVDIKTGASGGSVPQAWTRSDLSAVHCVPPEQILDLTGLIDTNGNLNWTPPSNCIWMVQRFGYTTTGQMNRPADGAIGLECDKFNPAAAEVQFTNWYGEAVRQVGTNLARRILSMHHTDSWECGIQNWSPVLRNEFISRRGYDPVPYLPAVTRIPVGSAEQSERFLWDFRRTMMELVSDSFFRPMVSLTHGQNAVYSSETMTGVMTDSLEFYREVDVPMGEFWISTTDQGAYQVPPPVFGAHIYGKKIIQAEAFTQRVIRWTEDPYFLKPLGDYEFSRGVNRFVLHVWAHQAFPDRVPGITLFNVYGTVFGGSQPWMETGGHAWIKYLTRCQSMLQQGIPVADVCYFLGEDIPTRATGRQDLNPPLPFGYDYDCINRDALLTRVMAANGKMVLPDGVSYSVLVLPDVTRMSPEVAQKIGELAEAGVKIIGAQPTNTYSLVGYPESDAQLQQIVASSWSNVQQNVTVVDVLQNAGLSRDVEFLGVNMSWIHRGIKILDSHADWNGEDDTNVVHQPELGMEYSSPAFVSCHRRTADNTDIYFVSNQDLTNKMVRVAFRVGGKKPELWNPQTGTIRDLTDWTVCGGRTVVPLKFEPAESYFVVFRTAASSGAETGNFPEYLAVQTVEGPWTVEFQPGRGAPDSIVLTNLISLSVHSDSGVKYFSGTATYSGTFTLSTNLLSRPNGERVMLDLGQVKNAAAVTLNGILLPAVWKPPFMVDVTDALRPGNNDLNVKVSNTWKNRLVADAELPVDQRITWTLFREDTGWSYLSKDVEPSGLIGPVVLLKEHK